MACSSEGPAGFTTQVRSSQALQAEEPAHTKARSYEVLGSSGSSGVQHRGARHRWWAAACWVLPLEFCRASVEAPQGCGVHAVTLSHGSQTAGSQAGTGEGEGGVCRGRVRARSQDLERNQDHEYRCAIMTSFVSH